MTTKKFHRYTYSVIEIYHGSKCLLEKQSISEPIATICNRPELENSIFVNNDHFLLLRKYDL